MQTFNQPQSSLIALVRSSTVKEAFGGISDMTLWRWIKRRNFPQPRKICGRNYWNPQDVENWLESHAS